MQCDKCGSDRIMQINGKTSDCCWVKFPEGREYDGYVLGGLGISKSDSGGDYIAFDYCLDCGKIQGEFPIPQENYQNI